MLAVVLLVAVATMQVECAPNQLWPAFNKASFEPLKKPFFAPTVGKETSSKTFDPSATEHAHEQFMNTWLRQARFNMNGPDFINLLRSFSANTEAPTQSILEESNAQPVPVEEAASPIADTTFQEAYIDEVASPIPTTDVHEGSLDEIASPNPATDFQEASLDVVIPVTDETLVNEEMSGTEAPLEEFNPTPFELTTEAISTYDEQTEIFPEAVEVVDDITPMNEELLVPVAEEQSSFVTELVDLAPVAEEQSSFVPEVADLAPIAEEQSSFVPEVFDLAPVAEVQSSFVHEAFDLAPVAEEQSFVHEVVDLSPVAEEQLSFEPEVISLAPVAEEQSFFVPEEVDFTPVAEEQLSFVPEAVDLAPVAEDVFMTPAVKEDKPIPSLVEQDTATVLTATFPAPSVDPEPIPEIAVEAYHEPLAEAQPIELPQPIVEHQRVAEFQPVPVSRPKAFVPARQRGRGRSFSSAQRSRNVISRRPAPAVTAQEVTPSPLALPVAPIRRVPHREAVTTSGLTYTLQFFPTRGQSHYFVSTPIGG